MKVLIAPDKFKGSMSAQKVCESVALGLKKSTPLVEISFCPLADGGDGSIAVLKNDLNLTFQEVETTDPLGRSITSHYFTSKDTAFIEVASASGLVLLQKKEQNPLLTSTVGTGKIMAHAISRGYKNMYLFLGGSATNDAGMGIASALGYGFLDKEKKELRPIGQNLHDVEEIVFSPIFDLTDIMMTLLCDVTNPLYGLNGAAYIYAGQKGANAQQIVTLDNGLRHFGGILDKYVGHDISLLPSSGAAGGIAAGLRALFGAKIKLGFKTIATLLNLEEKIQAADYIISGEGKLDNQSLQGKVVGEISMLCKKYKKPLVLMVGKNELTPKDKNKLNAKHIFSLRERANSTKDAIRNGIFYLENTAFEFLESIKI